MKKTLLNIVMLLTSLASLPASAALYNFSYTFTGGMSVTGSLTGNLVGDYVQNIGDVQVFFNGVQNTGTQYAVNYNPSFGWDNTANATVSTNASLNNFLFINSNYPSDLSYTNYFYMRNNGFYSDAYAWNSATGSGGFDYVYPSNPNYSTGIGHWSLTEATPVSAVPEPETYAMLLVGLGLIGFSARRRKDLDA